MRGTLRVPLIFCARRIKLQLIIYSEIFDLRRMWNNFLAKIVKYCSVVAMWNEICPHSRQRIFHICKANISQRSYFTCPKGKFRWKKHLPKQVLFSGSPLWGYVEPSASLGGMQLSNELHAPSLSALLYYSEAKSRYENPWVGMQNNLYSNE